MKHDLIFHLVSKRKWKEWQKSGFYRPENEDEWITCYTGEQVENIANRLFTGRKTILMLVINSRRVVGKIDHKVTDGIEYPVIRDKINLDAIIDKILLEPSSEGLFEINIEEK